MYFDGRREASRRKACTSKERNPWNWSTENVDFRETNKFKGWSEKSYLSRRGNLPGAENSVAMDSSTGKIFICFIFSDFMSPTNSLYSASFSFSLTWQVHVNVKANENDNILIENYSCTCARNVDPRVCSVTSLQAVRTSGSGVGRPSSISMTLLFWSRVKAAGVDLFAGTTCWMESTENAPAVLHLGRRFAWASSSILI